MKTIDIIFKKSNDYLSILEEESVYDEVDYKDYLKNNLVAFNNTLKEVRNLIHSINEDDCNQGLCKIYDHACKVTPFDSSEIMLGVFDSILPEWRYDSAGHSNTRYKGYCFKVLNRNKYKTKEICTIPVVLTKDFYYYRLKWLNRIIKLFDEYIEENNLLEHQNNEE